MSSPFETDRFPDELDPTRRRVLAAAHAEFAARGYTAVELDDVRRAALIGEAELAELFPNKRTLFAAVHEDVERGLLTQAAIAAASEGDPWSRILAGLRAYLDACLDPAVMQISLLDAPRVIGWQRWRAVAEQYGLGLLITTLKDAIEAGEIPEHDVQVVGHLLLGILGESSLMIANADDPRAARDRVEASVTELIEGMRLEVRTEAEAAGS